MDKEHLHNKIVRDIIASIFAGTYKPGQKLPAERTLSQRYDVSRGTVREALANLQKLGVVAVKHGSGIYVNEVADAQIPNTYLPPGFGSMSLGDILFARNAIEQAAIELAASSISKSELLQLATLIDKMETSLEDLPMFLKYDMEFHQSIIRASKNPALMRAFEAIHEYFKYSQVFTTQKPGDETVAVQFHRRILRSLETHNAKSSKRAINEHLKNMADSLSK